MARSLRSKRRKKLNAVKRQRYGKKELIRLKKMLGLPTGEKPDESADSAVKTEPEISEIANVVDFKEAQRQQQFGICDVDDAEMDDVSIVEVSRRKRIHKIRKSYKPNARIKIHKCSKHRERASEGTSSEQDQMEHDQQRQYNPKTKRDQHGNYPPWMNQKTVKLLAKQNKKTKSNKKKKQRKEDRRNRSRKYSNETMATATAGLTEAIIGLQKFGVNTPSL